MSVQGFFVCLIAAAWLLWLTSLLLSAIRITAQMKLGPRGGFGRLRIRWLLLCVTLRFRVNILRPPRGSIQLVFKNGRRKRLPLKRKRRKKRGRPALPAPDALTLHFTAGIRNDPALSALVCGWLRESAALLLGPLLPAGWHDALRISAEPVCMDDALFVQASGMITLTPAHSIFMWIQSRKRGEA